MGFRRTARPQCDRSWSPGAAVTYLGVLDPSMQQLAQPSCGRHCAAVRGVSHRWNIRAQRSRRVVSDRTDVTGLQHVHKPAQPLFSFAQLTSRRRAVGVRIAVASRMRRHQVPQHDAGFPGCDRSLHDRRRWLAPAMRMARRAPQLRFVVAELSFTKQAQPRVARTAPARCLGNEQHRSVAARRQVRE